MITAKQLCEQVKIPLDEGWGYIWGTYGQLWTEKSKITSKAPASSKSNAAKYGNKWIGKRVTDCSGLLYWAFKELGGYIFHGANTIWNSYTTSKGKITGGITLRPGTAVFLTSNNNRHHIGLYVGGDTVIEAKGTMYGVVTSPVSHWDEWGELKGVDYAEAEGVVVKASRQTLRLGSASASVTEMQKLLQGHGFTLEADGVFGSRTQAVLKSFQASKGLTADGVCGPLTWAQLDMETASSVSSVTKDNDIPAESKRKKDEIIAQIRDLLAELEAEEEETNNGDSEYS